MPIVTVLNKESFELALRKFKKLCDKNNILTEIRKHDYYEKPSIKRKHKKTINKKRKNFKINKKINNIT